MTDGPSGSYADIFENQGVPEQFRGPDDYFFHTVTEAESGAHAGEIYAIPRQVHVGGDFHGLYDMYENGAIVNVRTDLDPDSDVTIEGRAVVNARSIHGNTAIGWAAVVSSGVGINSSVLHDQVEVGPHTSLDLSRVGDRTTLGESVDMTGTIVGTDAKIEDHTLFMGGNAVGDFTTVSWGASLEKDAVAGRNVQIDQSARLDKGARVEDDSRVMPNVSVKADKRIRKGTIVVPQQYRRAKRGR
jgi:bifunctional N-acetylglucosamine-1-phosphate-uridyltransferase/glucosamine-1-phosphate-acetyltransferase GlmU-like protein